MKGQALHIALIVPVLLFIDLYVFNGLISASKKKLFLKKKWFRNFYWIFSILLLSGAIAVIYIKVGMMGRLAFIVLFFLVLIFKVCFVPFILVDDIHRLIIAAKNRIKKQTDGRGVSHTPAVENGIHETKSTPSIPRSEFLMKAGLLAGSIPLAALKLNMRSGLYDYHVISKKLYLPNLPKAFDGIRLGQISDIHSGSFYDKKAVTGGVEMLRTSAPSRAGYREN